MKKLVLPAITLLFACSAVALEYKVVAEVEGESISSVQVRDRVDLALSSGGQQLTPENRKKITPEIVDVLIDEVLQKKDADAKKITIPDAEFKDVMTQLEASNHLKPGGFKDFIGAKGISYNAVVAQIKASILWRKIISKYIRPTVNVSKEDIAKAQSYVEKPAPDQPAHSRVNISEIIIPIEYGKDKEAKDLADTIIRTASSGAKDFGELAKKYSVGKTAANKGEVGWAPEEALVEPIASNIKSTPAGGVTKPIRIKSIFVILRVNDRQTQEAVVHKKLSPEDRATMNKMEDAAKKYMKGLRDNAYVKRRYTDADLYSYVWGE